MINGRLIPDPSLPRDIKQHYLAGDILSRIWLGPALIGNIAAIEDGLKLLIRGWA